MRWRRACRGDPLDDQSRYIAAGGLNDAIARALGQRLAEAWGQQVWSRTSRARTARSARPYRVQPDRDRGRVVDCASLLTATVRLGGGPLSIQEDIVVSLTVALYIVGVFKLITLAFG